MIILTEGPRDPKHKKAIDAILANAKRYNAPVTMHPSDKTMGFKFQNGKDADTVYLFAKDDRDIERWRLDHKNGDVWIDYDDDRREE
jgi:hypothetical protein